MKEKIPPVKAGNDKHGLTKMKINTHKDFELELYDTIRLAAWYRSKVLGRKYITRKMLDKSKCMIVRVFYSKA